MFDHFPFSDSGRKIRAEVCITYDSSLIPSAQTRAMLALWNNIKNGGSRTDSDPFTISDLIFLYDTDNPLDGKW